MLDVVTFVINPVHMDAPFPIKLCLVPVTLHWSKPRSVTLHCHHMNSARVYG